MQVVENDRSCLRVNYKNAFLFL